MTDFPFARMLHKNSKDRRVQMKVEMAIDVIERKTRGSEFFKLRLDFRLQLRPKTSFGKIAETDSHRAVAESPPGINQPRNHVRRKRGMAAEQR